MGAAVAIAILLVVGTGVLSLGLNSQAQGPGPRLGQPGARTAPRPEGAAPRRPVRPSRDRPDKEKRADRRTRPDAPPTGPPVPGPPPSDDPAFVVDVKPLNTQAHALVVSVVDERTLGPVTRSRLTLRVEPPEGEPFEVTTRVAFQTPQERSKVKVGGTIAVRYDSEDRRRVVVDPEADAQQADGAPGDASPQDGPE